MLNLDFYDREDVVQIAKDLIGTEIYTQFGDDPITGGRIIETEAYGGVTDRASHAFGGRLTKRTRIMFGDPGHAYVYLCYGMYPLLNIVTNERGTPHCVLIRSIEPLVGMEKMAERRKGKLPLAIGPGRTTGALGINLKHNGMTLDTPHFWLEPRKIFIPDSAIIPSNRIGIDYAKEDAFLPWRFTLAKI